MTTTGVRGAISSPGSTSREVTMPPTGDVSFASARVFRSVASCASTASTLA